MAELKGRAVSVGAPGSGTELIADRVLAPRAWTRAKTSRAIPLGVAESVGAIKDGKVDAFFWSGGLPTASVQDLAATPGVSLSLLPSDGCFRFFSATSAEISTAWP